MRILTILGQRPAATGSGVVVQELWRQADARGDLQHLICAGYPEDRWELFGDRYRMVEFSKPGSEGKTPLLIPGMSDVMPYQSARYVDLSDEAIDSILRSYSSGVLEALANFRPDILHIHHMWILADMARHARVPCVVTVHGTDLMQAKLAPRHRHIVVRNADAIAHFFCVSSDMAAGLQAEYGILSSKISVIGNGFDPNGFSVEGDTESLPGKLVLCTGKFVAWKGYHLAIRACARVKQPHRLVILGAGSEAATADLVNESRRQGIHVTWPGHVSPPEVARWMRRADVFVLPSVREPFGLALLEALACGCRTVSSDAGGPRDMVSQSLVRDGLATLLRPLDLTMPKDEERYVSELAEAIDFHLQRDQAAEDRHAIAKSVASRTWKAAYEKIRAEYVSLIKVTR